MKGNTNIETQNNQTKNVQTRWQHVARLASFQPRKTTKLILPKSNAPPRVVGGKKEWVDVVYVAMFDTPTTTSRAPNATSQSLAVCVCVFVEWDLRHRNLARTEHGFGFGLGVLAADNSENLGRGWGRMGCDWLDEGVCVHTLASMVKMEINFPFGTWHSRRVGFAGRRWTNTGTNNSKSRVPFSSVWGFVAANWMLQVIRFIYATWFLVPYVLSKIIM